MVALSCVSGLTREMCIKKYMFCFPPFATDGRFSLSLTALHVLGPLCAHQRLRGGTKEITAAFALPRLTQFLRLKQEAAQPQLFI